ATPHGEWELSSSPSLQAGVRWAHAKDSASSPDRVRGQWMEWHEASIGPNPNLRIVSADPVLPEPRFERHGACAQTDMHWALHEEEGSLATRSKLGLPPSPSEASSQESGDEVSIVLAFRGTASVQNVFSDLNFALRPLELGGRTFSPSPLSSPMAGSPRAGSEAEGEIPVQEYAALRGSHAGRVDQKFTPRKLFPSGSSSSAQGLRPLEPGFVRQISEQLREATTSALSPRGLGVTDSEPVLVHRGFSQAYMSVRSEVMELLRVPLAIGLYGVFLDAGLGPHLGLCAGVALSSAGEVALTGWSERFGVHMGLRQIRSYSESYRISRDARGGALKGAWAGAGGLWVRNFAWNFSFFEWKRYLHNAVDKTPQGAPTWFCAHLDWLRSLDKKNQANFLTFEAATLGTYLTFFNMAGDNIKTKMQYDPVQYPSFTGTVKQIWSQHGLVGFARGSLFKGIYLILGSTIAIGIQERLSDIMASFVRR
ncbi:unnamed protein product, partial [Polarella glacialis]